MAASSAAVSYAAGLLLTGVWRAESTGAFLYGLFLVALDLLYTRIRVARAQIMSKKTIGAYILRTFLARLALYLIGIALAVRIFDAQRVIIVGAVLLLAIPAGLVMAARLGKPSGG